MRAATPTQRSTVGPSAFARGATAASRRTRELAAPPPRRAKRRDVYVYFDNDIKVHAPYDALSLAAKVEARNSNEKTRRQADQQADALPR